VNDVPVPAGITEADIAEYLANTPEFFSRHVDMLAAIQLPSPHGGRAVSLHERQLDLQRERYRALEAQQAELLRARAEMIRAGTENVEIARKMHRWVCAVMLARKASLLGQVLIEELKHQFGVPQAAVRVWGAAPQHSHLPWAREVSDDVRTFAASLAQPYCGPNVEFEAAAWLALPEQAASPDVARYRTDMATDFLEQLGDVASAALARLISGD
jgi:uncharacterized protein YigA (DUF484 family)